jgi:hypothetical protein
VRYHVAPNGRDAWSGKLARPNAGRTDGPFATLARARDALRRDKDAGALQGGATVRVATGDYLLREPIVFEPRDSGSPNGPIVYEGNGQARFSGGRRISNWTISNGRWQTTLPEVREGKWNFSQLWVNGARRSRPRLPKSGYFFIERAIEPSTSETRGHDRFGYTEGEVNPAWANLSDVDFLMMQVWTMPRMKARDIDAASRIVTFTAPSTTRKSYGAFPRGNRYLVENVKEALGSPGEWYLDRPTGVLTYIPMPGENPRTSVVVAPQTSSFVQFRGGADGKSPVSDITLRGLRFEHANWNTPPEGNIHGQAEVSMSGAIRAEGADRVSIEDCVVSRVGEYAIEIGRACHNNRIENCEMIDLAAGGVKIGTTDNPSDPQVLASGHIVRNNLIAHFGRMHPAGIGVWIGQSPENIVSHNTIRDCYYTGIAPGWSWGYNPAGMHHNTVAYNHISQIGQGVLSDMGGIYTLGVSPGTVMHHNRIHDISSFDYGGWGIYFDEGTSGVVAENNLVYRTKSAGLQQHYGRDNVVRNNIFAFGGDGQMRRSRDENHFSFSIERNIVLYNDRPLLDGSWNRDSKYFRLDNNLYWNIGKEPVRFAGKTLEEWRALGHDRNSLIADPQFVNWKAGDFRLRPTSPALKLGFVPFDVSRAGRVDRTGKAVAYTQTAPRAFPTPPPPAPIIESFEETSPGGQWQFNTSEEPEVPAATARVTEEASSPFEPRGKRSLKFTDAPGQKGGFNPHIYANPGFTKGILQGRFDLRREAGSHLSHEWRDETSPYKVGPSLAVGGEGQLNVNDRTLMTLKAGVWYRFDITYTLGSGKWSLMVTDESGAASTFPDLTCNPAMEELKWWGFSANAQENAVFYLDNAQVRMEK